MISLLSQPAAHLKLLALDTATEACSAALLVGDELLEHFEVVQQGHSARLLPMIEALLAQAQLSLAQLDAIAFGRGPGSFTALRIGAGVTQGLAFGADLPVVPVSSLAALAQGIDAARVLAAFDARMDQVYWGAYVRDPQGTMVAVTAEAVLHPGVVTAPEGPWVGAGGGWDRYASILTPHLGGRVTRWEPRRYPRARDVARLALPAYQRGETVDAEAALPVYVRDDVARKPG